MVKVPTINIRVRELLSKHFVKCALLHTSAALFAFHFTILLKITYSFSPGFLPTFLLKLKVMQTANRYNEFCV